MCLPTTDIFQFIKPQLSAYRTNMGHEISFSTMSILGTFISINRYFYVLTYFISPVVSCPGRDIETKHSHHVVPRPHTDRQMTVLLQQFEWECLEHLLYSPDIAPSDFSILSKVWVYEIYNKFSRIHVWARGEVRNAYILAGKSQDSAPLGRFRCRH